MKVEFRQECEIQGKKFGHTKHRQPGIHEVPASFIFDWFFVALVKDGHAEILEAFHSEFESYSEEELSKIDKRFFVILGDILEKESDDEINSDIGSVDSSLDNLGSGIPASEDVEQGLDEENEDESEDESEDDSEEEEVSEVVKVSKKKKKKGKR